jgi:hypothetical protein
VKGPPHSAAAPVNARIAPSSPPNEQAASCVAATVYTVARGDPAQRADCRADSMSGEVLKSVEAPCDRPASPESLQIGSHLHSSQRSGSAHQSLYSSTGNDARDSRCTVENGSGRDSPSILSCDDLVLSSRAGRAADGEVPAQWSPVGESAFYVSSEQAGDSPQIASGPSSCELDSSSVGKAENAVVHTVPGDVLIGTRVARIDEDEQGKVGVRQENQIAIGLANS